MMENKITNINFVLRKVTTEQFAIIEEGFSEHNGIRIGTSIRFGSDEKQKMVACFSAFTFESNGKPFIKVEAGCHFQILEEAWNQMLNVEKNTLKVPKGFLSHLAMLTVGTTRGLLHAKTEGTCFNKYVIPTINVSTLIIDDALFIFKSDLVK